MRTNPKILLAALLGALLAGCPQPADPDAIPEELRSACPSLSDADIRSLIITAESDREAGRTKDECVAAVIESCWQMPWWEDCQTCAINVIGYVYDQ